MDARELLSAFKEKVSKSEFDTFISNLSLDDKLTKPDYIVFNAPNDLVAKFIQTRYANKISEHYEILSGNKAKVYIHGKNKKKSKQIPVQNTINLVQGDILIPDFTFDSFVVGPSNEYAYSVCKAVSNKKNLGKLYNPIFIYGPTGLGKTHLMQAVGNACAEFGKKIVNVVSTRFANDFVYHLENNILAKFREKYTSCDVLLIDDVQFLGKTDRIQDEFFSIFNEIKSKAGQIIVTSDNPPNMLRGITDRLKSRFANGIIADITQPELDTKKAIIRKKCEMNDIRLNDDIIFYIASSMGDNIREIEGMITNINAYSKIMGIEINLEIVKMIMKDHIKETKENISLDDIFEVICKEFNVKSADVKSNKKTSNIVKIKRIIIFLARELTTVSTPQLARVFSMKDHTSISHNIKKIREEIEKDNELQARINELKNKILIKRRNESEIMWKK